MCPPAEDIEENKATRVAPAAEAPPNNTALLVGFCAIVTVVSLVAAIVFGLKANDNNSGGGTSAAGSAAAKDFEVIQAKAATFTINVGDNTLEAEKPPEGTNICDGAKPELPNAECLTVAITNVKPQSGANVTKGYKGNLVVDHQPITTPYFRNGMCPVNVHWHLGTEHYSVGEYDETGTFPEIAEGNDRRKLAELAKPGFHCKKYNAEDPKFNTPYKWKHCVGMVVGETYEVHWPHSAAGACGTPNQYQTPFYDGVFCRGIKAEDGSGGVLDLSRTHEQIGVQAQIFTIVNDEEHYYPDLFRGMIVDGEMGLDMHYYTGSTTGTSRNNTICSQYSAITWQVDRKCHLISASSFDKMCADMKSQRDDMTGDLYAHGSRDLVDDDYVANNGQRKRKQRSISA